MKAVIFSLAMTMMIFTAESCSSTRHSSRHNDAAMGQRDRDNEVVIKRKKNVDEDGVTVKTDKINREDNGNVTKTERKKVYKSNDDGTTVKVKKEKKHRRNHDKNDDALIIDTNR
jgi:hypothetical protein